MKPAETGVTDAGPQDALALRAAAGARDPLEEICPVQLAMPAAPTVAAAAEGIEVDLERVRASYVRLASHHDFMLVEGAGGLLVPLAKGISMAEFAAELDLPVLLVARAALGTINHTLLSVEAIRARGLTLAGVVISHAGGVLSDPDAANLASLRDSLAGLLVGEIPPLGEGEVPADDAVDLERILSRSS